MFDDFFIRALFAGIGIALITGPFGCFIIWRRFSFFAGTLAHSALLGVTMAVFFDINIAFAVFLISAALAIILLKLQKKNKITKRCFTWLTRTRLIGSRFCYFRFFNINQI